MTFTFNIGSSRGHGPLLLTGGLHFIILAIAAQSESAEVWPFALLAMSVVSFFAWIGNYRRYRVIHDLPTSNVASAAQGYVELVGVGRLIDGSQIYCPISQRPCCWYRYTVEEEVNDDKYKIVDEGSSVAHFLLVDESGPCVISPDGAEVITRHHKTWSEGNMRYSETLLLPDTPLYAVGEFITHTGNVPTPADERSDVGALLSDWKNDKTTLLKRFDLDGDGKISLKEWELARMQAMREVRKRRAEQLGNFAEGVHLLRKPGDGRLFLLASELPEDLGRRYQLWSWFHLAAFLGFGVTGLVLLGVR